jgi:threonine dehydratase
MPTPLWQKTPLIYSTPLSNNINASVYLKLEVRDDKKEAEFPAYSIL